MENHEVILILSLLTDNPPSPGNVSDTTGVYVPYSFRKGCGFFYVPEDPKCCTWDGPTIFCPYPRRLESLTVCRCHYKGSTFPECWSGRRLKPATSHSANRCSHTWANQAAVVNLTKNFSKRWRGGDIWKYLISSLKVTNKVWY